MTGTSRNVMRFVLLILVIQFISPIFSSVITPGINTNEEKLSGHAHHSSLVAPQLLKEKEESDTAIEEVTSSFITLIDFSDLPSVLTAAHATKIIPFAYHERIDHHPPLYTLHSVYLI